MNDRMTITEALAALAAYGPAVWLGVRVASPSGLSMFSVPGMGFTISGRKGCNGTS